MGYEQRSSQALGTRRGPVPEGSTSLSPKAQPGRVALARAESELCPRTPTAGASEGFAPLAYDEAGAPGRVATPSPEAKRRSNRVQRSLPMMFAGRNAVMMMGSPPACCVSQRTLLRGLHAADIDSRPEQGVGAPQAAPLVPPCDGRLTPIKKEEPEGKDL